MTATLFIPGQPSQLVAHTDLSLPTAGHASIPDKVAEYLGCKRDLVDVLDSGPDYAAYAVFDCEQGENQSAVDALAVVSTNTFAADLPMVYGPVLLVTRH